MKLTVIGCSGSFPAPESAASCYLVEADDVTGRRWRVLLDLGAGAVGPLQRFVTPQQVDAVLLSHLHPDHCVDVCGLFVALRYHPAGSPAVRTPIYGPSGTARRLEAIYGAEPGCGLAEVFDIREWRDNQPVRIGPFVILPRLVDHSVEAYGLRVEEHVGQPVEEHAGQRVAVLAYSGDTDACPSLVKVADGADVLLSEAAFVQGRDTRRHIHLTGLRAGQVARDAGVGRLLLTHLPVWTPAETALAEARSVFAGPTDVVSSGAVYEI